MDLPSALVHEIIMSCSFTLAIYSDRYASFMLYTFQNNVPILRINFQKSVNYFLAHMMGAFRL